jgi:hypothetical protein
MTQGPIDFDSESLLREAERQTGLSDWGDDPSFCIGLGKLLAAVDAMPSGAALRPAITGQAVQLLSTRLRLEEDARQHPEILDGKIERPLIVAGLPRTGTSWLFELLALDPAARPPLEWEAALPCPAPEITSYTTDPRIGQVQAGFDAMLVAAPELATMHEFGALLPAECNNIMQFHFASSNFWASCAVPDYLRWLSTERPQGTFKTHRRVLQQLQWKGPKGRWTLKSPPHLLVIEDLLAAYPDACIIQTHREPARTVVSLANMVLTIRKARFPQVEDIHDPKEIASSVLFHFGEALERGTASRESPEVDRHFFDVAYRDLVADPTPVIKAIYAHFELPFTQEFQDRLAAHLATPRLTGHGAHKYDMAGFGIDELDLPRRFPTYRDRFGNLLADNVN